MGDGASSLSSQTHKGRGHIHLLFHAALRVNMASADYYKSPTTASLQDCNRFMFEQQLACDISFVFSSPDGSDVSLDAHRYMLISRSPVFRTMLCGALQLEDKHIPVRDISPEAFKELLRFLYYEEAELDDDIVSQVLYGAKKYLVPSLDEKCVRYMLENIQSENVCTVLEESYLFEEKQLQSKCMEYIQQHTEAVLQSETFYFISQKTLLEIVKQDSLGITEETLLDACLKWANQRCAHESIESTSLNQRKVLGEVLFQIRMGSISPEWLQRCVLGSGLLTNEEERVISGGVNHNKQIISPFQKQKRIRGYSLLNTCPVVKKAVSSTILAGRWYEVPFEVFDDIYIHSLQILNHCHAYPINAVFSIEQDGQILSHCSTCIPVQHKTSHLGPQWFLKLRQPTRVTAGHVTIKVKYRFVGGVFGTVSGGIPCQSLLTCGGVTFSFPPDCSSSISSVCFALAEDWDNATAAIRKKTLDHLADYHI